MTCERGSNGGHFSARMRRECPRLRPAAAFEDRFNQNRWNTRWRDGIYSYHYFHSTAHEVLGIARGKARVQSGLSGRRRLPPGFLPCGPESLTAGHPVG